MKTQKFVSLILALMVVLTLFSGCSFQMTTFPQATKATTGSPSLESTHMDTTEATQATTATQPDSTATTQPSATISRPLPEHRDVINGVYATCGNYDYVISSTTTAQISFYLLCEEPLPGDATITVDTDSTYQVSIHDRTPDRVGLGYLPDLWYMTEKGVDMAKYYQLYNAYLEARDKFSSGQITQDEYTEAIEPWKAFQAEYIMPAMNAYTEYGKTPCPFYYYLVYLRVKHTGTEVLTHVQLDAGDMSREIPLGRIELRYEKAPQSTGSGAELVSIMEMNDMVPNINELSFLLSKTGRIGGSMNDPWCPYDMYTSFGLVAKEDITLTDLYFLDDGTDTLEFTGMDFLIVGKNGTVQLTWDPETPVFIRKGEKVLARAYYNSPYFQQAECHVQGNLVLEYTDSQGGGKLCKSAGAWRQRAPLEIYQWAFQNIDTKSFYTEAYYKYGVYGYKF